MLFKIFASNYTTVLYFPNKSSFYKNLFCVSLIIHGNRDLIIPTITSEAILRSVFNKLIGVQLPIKRNTAFCDKVCHLLAAGRWFSRSTLVSSTNKTNPNTNPYDNSMVAQNIV